MEPAPDLIRGPPSSAFKGRFVRFARAPLTLQTDPIGYADQMNLYAYVGNDLINATDPSGMESYIVSRRIFGPTQARARHCCLRCSPRDACNQNDSSERRL